MILTDYLRTKEDLSWAYAKQCGVKHCVIRLPEETEFDITSETDWKQMYQKFVDFGLQPVVLEPIPDWLHTHIKLGDAKRDESIAKLVKAFPIMASLGINTICFNFMAHIGWCRTSHDLKERGDGEVTGFCISDFTPIEAEISEETLWQNYEYFLRKVLPYAEKYGIQLALHPDDPPIAKLGDVSRIMVSYANIKKAMELVPSDYLGITMCQACYYLMVEDLEQVISEMKEKIFFIHFRNVRGNRFDFRETFHDDGDIPMAKLMKLYTTLGIDAPIRVDHVPLMANEEANVHIHGYSALGRLYAIGYMRGLLENCLY